MSIDLIIIMKYVCTINYNIFKLNASEIIDLITVLDPKTLYSGIVVEYLY